MPSPDLPYEDVKIDLTRLEPGSQIFYHGAGGFALAEHHAIYIGEGAVIEFSGEGTDFAVGGNGTAVNRIFSLSAGGSNNVVDPASMCVRVVSYDDFYTRAFRVNSESLSGVFVREYSRGVLPNELVVHRALDRVGSNFGGYHIVRNNCEHFAMWCKTGKAECPQMRVHGMVAGGLAGFALGGPIGMLMGAISGSMAGHHMMRQSSRPLNQSRIADVPSHQGDAPSGSGSDRADVVDVVEVAEVVEVVEAIIEDGGGS
eukprot:Rmarinus@m.20139